MAIDLDETYWDLHYMRVVRDCDYGLGQEFQFIHEGKTLAFTVYADTKRVSLTDVTEDEIDPEADEKARWL